MYHIIATITTTGLCWYVDLLILVFEYDLLIFNVVSKSGYTWLYQMPQCTYSKVHEHFPFLHFICIQPSRSTHDFDPKNPIFSMKAKYLSNRTSMISALMLCTYNWTHKWTKIENLSDMVCRVIYSSHMRKGSLSMFLPSLQCPQRLWFWFTTAARKIQPPAIWNLLTNQ